MQNYFRALGNGNPDALAQMSANLQNSIGANTYATSPVWANLIAQKKGTKSASPAQPKINSAQLSQLLVKNVEVIEDAGYVKPSGGSGGGRRKTFVQKFKDLVSANAGRKEQKVLDVSSFKPNDQKSTAKKQVDTLSASPERDRLKSIQVAGLPLSSSDGDNYVNAVNVLKADPELSDKYNWSAFTLEAWNQAATTAATLRDQKKAERKSSKESRNGKKSSAPATSTAPTNVNLFAGLATQPSQPAQQMSQAPPPTAVPFTPATFNVVPQQAMGSGST